jgi:hypothetical protein
MEERDIQADKTVEADDTKILTSTIDRSIVLSSIDERLSEIKAAWREKHSDANPNKEAFYFQCMYQTAQSLKQQILNVTTAVDEASLNQRLSALQT